MPRIPFWALEHLNETLPPGNPLVRFEQVHHNRVLVNTPTATLLVRRSVFGPIRHQVIATPPAALPDGRDLGDDGCACCLPQCCETGECCDHASCGANCADDSCSDDACSDCCCEGDCTCDASCSDGACCCEGDCSCEGGSCAPGGPYTHNGYTLYARQSSKGNPLYFFAKNEPKEGVAQDRVPHGYAVGENSKTGLPFLRKLDADEIAAASHDDGHGDHDHAPEEAEGYTGDSHPVEAIEGVGAKLAARLQGAGVHTTDELYRAPTEALATAIDVPEETVNEWQTMAELIMVNGIGPQYAEALALAGIDGIDGLKKGTPTAIAEQVNDYLDSREVRLTAGTISATRVAAWQKAARTMKRETVLVHELA